MTGHIVRLLQLCRTFFHLANIKGIYSNKVLKYLLMNRLSNKHFYLVTFFYNAFGK